MALSTEFFKFFLDPFNIVLFLMLVTVILIKHGWKKAGKRMGFFTLIWFIVISTSPVPDALLGSLENRYEPIWPEMFSEDELQLPYDIVVLGGGHGYDDRLPANSLLSSQALARLAEGIRLQRQLPNSRLVLSGYSASGRIPQAEMLSKTAQILGVDPGLIVTQSDPGNTAEEAEEYIGQFGTQSPLIIVTSASHMPRAVGEFRRRGIEPTASPTYYRIKNDSGSRFSLFPSTTHIGNLRTAIYEYAALLRLKVVS